ncbi:MAG: GTPase domain-containing protein [Sandaracinus sp.]|nr:GTPase domain-containing protein [Sandaracinus sp.]
MPHRDKRTGDLVIRIVYDGAPEAGKTTNIRVLHESLLLQRRGTLASPGTTGRRTEFFDWRDFPGGYLEGHRLRCQLVSVPGQPSLLRRRRYLLESADAVVLVADSTPGAVEGNREMATTLLELVARIHAEVPIGIILQANKQDLPGALTPNVLGALLGMPEDAPTIAAEAENGVGVRECFLTAVRLAAEHVRRLIAANALEERDDHEATPEALLAALLEAEKEDETPPDEAAPPFPAARLVPTGSVWPSNVRPRLLETLALPFERAAACRPWAPPRAFEWRHDGHVLLTRPTWRFEELDEARRALLALVRHQLQLGELVPASRGFFLAQATGEQGGWWIWMLTSDETTLAAALDALDRSGADDLAALAETLRRAWKHVCEVGQPLDPAWLVEHAIGYAYLPVPSLVPTPPTKVPEPWREPLRALLGDAWPDL